MNYYIGIAVIIILILVFVQLRQTKSALTTSTNLLTSDGPGPNDPINTPIWDTSANAFRYQLPNNPTWFTSPRVVYVYKMGPGVPPQTVPIQDNARLGSGLFLAQFAGDYVLWYGYYQGGHKNGYTYVISSNDIGDDLNNSGMGQLTHNKKSYPNSITATYKNTGGYFTITQLAPYSFL